MFLKKIEIKGFKSFADRIDLDFISGITCVVGPNGSGKSNITDAIRWVLGEQKTSLLRGQKMEDLIFSGTEHRKPLNFAEVALVFDNETGFFNTDFTEVKIKRRLHRSGESEYLLNEAPCRLKDIRELIMDTGIGIDGYSIIGQGNIDRILSDNKFDRRQIFEEAAGIVKFNTKKNESVRRLEKVDLNIERISDIVKEVQERIEPLKEESEKAREFLEIESVVRNSEIKYMLDEYDGYKADSMAGQRDKKTAEAALDNATRLRVHHEENQVELQQEIRTLKQSAEGLELKHQHLSREKDELNLDIKLREEKLSAKNHEIENLKLSDKNETKHHDFLVSEIEQANLHLEQMGKENINCEGDLAGYIQELEDATEAFRLVNSDKDELIKQLATYHSQLEVFRTDKRRSNEILEKNQGRLTATQSNENDALNAIKLIQKQIADNTEEREQIKSDIDSAQTLLKLKKVEWSDFEDRQDQVKEQLEETNRKKYRAESEIQLLNSLEKNYEGVQGYMKKILRYIENHRLDQKIKGIVADIITIPSGYEEAMSVALGKSATHIVTKDENDAKMIIDKLKRDKVGRATFLPLSFLKARSSHFKIDDPGCLGFAREIVQYDSQYETLVDYLLGKVVVAKTIDDAIRISKTLKGYYKIVTLEGDVIITNGPITGGAKVKGNDNLFKRKQELKVLNQKLAEMTKAVKRDQALYQELQGSVKRIEDEVDKYENKLSESKIRFNQLETAYQVLINQLEADNKAYEGLKSAREVLEAEIQRENMNLTVIEEASADIEREKNKIETVISDQQGDQVDEIVLKKIEENMTAVKIRMAKLDENIKNTHAAIEEKGITLETLKEDIAAMQLRIEEMSSEAKDEQDLLDNRRNTYGGLLERIQSHDEKRQENRSSLNENEQTLEENFIQQKKVESSINESRQVIHERELEIAKLDIKISNLSNKMWETYELSIAEARSTIIELETFISRNELRKLRKRLKEIEHVNLNAIQEYEEVKDRYEFLSTQMDDLLKSKDELTRFIRQMERKIVSSFKETFNNINNSFQQVFSDLFGGGKSELRMTDPDDVLGTDIEILASPPGKNMKHINLLSGGEKALTAIALLFSVLKAKPTPFCVLDEIEAALDDSNVFRFGEFVRAFSKESQFILITHRKGTMEYADALYGVSMEEFGVSKVISIKLADYDFKEEDHDQEAV